MLAPVPQQWLPKYHRRLQSSHDARFHVDVLTLDEDPAGTVYLLDGQVTYQDKTNLVRRTANLTLADPDGALDVAAGATWLGSGLWMNRLVRIRHVTVLPGYGPVSVVVFIGVPTAMSRQGPTVTVDLADKMQLASNGVPTYTVRKGWNAVESIKKMMRTSGEFRFRIPPSNNRLSRDYTVTLTTEGGPAKVAKQMAEVEFGQEFLAAGDGYIMMRPQPTVSVAEAGPLLDVPQSSADFTEVRNRVTVLGAKVVKKSGSTTTTTQATATVELRSDNPLSAQALARKGVPRYFTTVEQRDAITKTSQAARRAKQLIARFDGPVEEINVNAFPMYHLDNDDIVTVRDGSGGTRDLRLTTATIPLLGDDSGMSIGYRKVVAVGSVKRPRTRYRRSKSKKK